MKYCDMLYSNDHYLKCKHNTNTGSKGAKLKLIGWMMMSAFPVQLGPS